jgi:hypothetical protein
MKIIGEVIAKLLQRQISQKQALKSIRQIIRKDTQKWLS